MVNDQENRITVTVKSFATLRDVMDKEVSLECPEGATIRTLLDGLTGRYTGLSGQLFTAPGIFRNYVNVLKNGRNIQFLAGLDTPIGDGDVIALFPPVAGG